MSDDRRGTYGAFARQQLLSLSHVLAAEIERLDRENAELVATVKRMGTENAELCDTVSALQATARHQGLAEQVRRSLALARRYYGAEGDEWTSPRLRACLEQAMGLCVDDEEAA